MSEAVDALVIGAGPAGLMAAEALMAPGRRVVVAEAMPTPARKFLMAGKSGLNLTRAEPAEVFAARLDGGAAPEPPGFIALGHPRPCPDKGWRDPAQAVRWP